MALSYLLTFCRIAIGLAFAVALVAEAKDVARFAETIGDFDLLPGQFARIAAVLFLSGEATVVLLLILDGHFLSLAFALAGLLLFVFTLALLSVLARNIQTSCNCFGTSEKPLTYYDVWRNAGLILLATAGLAMSETTGALPSLAFIELLFVFIIAAVFVLLWSNLSEIVALFQAA